MSIGTAVSSAFGGTFDVPAVLEVVGFSKRLQMNLGSVYRGVDSMIMPAE